MPTAQITVSAKYVAFRFGSIPSRELDVYLSMFKRQFPLMQWNDVERVWQLPHEQLQPVYEACRAFCGPAHVRLTINYNGSKRPYQPALF